MKIVLFLCFIIAALISCNAPVQETEQPVVSQETKDQKPPLLISITPQSGSKIADTPRSSIEIVGILKDESSITGTLEDTPLRFIPKDGVYHFNCNMTLVPGENIFLLKVQDAHGNLLQKEITYLNGEAPRLILQPERQQLPPGGHTFFEVFLEKEGQRQPLSFNEIEIQSQQGYFQGPKYQAPTESGSDIVSAYYRPENAKGRIRIYIRKSSMEINIKGSNEIFLGNQAKFNIQIVNGGELESLRNRVSIKLPKTCEFVSAEQQGEYLAPIREIYWNFATLGPGVQENLQCMIQAAEIGEDKLICTVEAAKEKIAETSIPISVIGGFTIEHKSDFTTIPVDKDVTIQFTLNGRLPVQNLQLAYRFDAEKIVFVQAAGNDAQGNKLQFLVSGDIIQISPKLALASQATISAKLQFKARRIGTITNVLECSYNLKDGTSQSIQDSITLYAE